MICVTHVTVYALNICISSVCHKYMYVTTLLINYYITIYVIHVYYYH